MGVEFEVREGTAYSTCNADFPNVYFMVNGHWLQIPSVDYLVEEGSECRLRIRPIDAGFNILGMPAYIGYYVTHTWATETTQASISIAPHTDSLKPALESGKVPKQALLVTYESENTENGETWAFGIALFCALLAATFWVAITWNIYDNGSMSYFQNTTEAAGFGAAGLIGVAISFVILNWILLSVFMPGNVVLPIEEADEAVTKINATNMTIFGLVSLFVYKLCGKKQVEKKTEVVAEPQAEVDELINSIE